MQRRPRRGRFPWAALILAIAGIRRAVGLGTWQVQRLPGRKRCSPDRPAHPSGAAPAGRDRGAVRADRRRRLWPVELRGTFDHAKERHFFATHDGAVRLLRLHAAAACRRPLSSSSIAASFPTTARIRRRGQQGQVDGAVTITGLARNPLAEKPSSLVPDNEPAKNIFYWKDLDGDGGNRPASTGRRCCRSSSMPGRRPNPGGLPVGGVTIVDLPNNHLQYAVTWYGLAAALAGVASACSARGCMACAQGGRVGQCAAT